MFYHCEQKKSPFYISNQNNILVFKHSTVLLMLSLHLKTYQIQTLRCFFLPNHLSHNVMIILSNYPNRCDIKQKEKVTGKISTLIKLNTICCLQNHFNHFYSSLKYNGISV